MRGLSRVRRPAYKGTDLVCLKDGESMALVFDGNGRGHGRAGHQARHRRTRGQSELLYEYELVGVSRADAAELRKARRQFSPEQGYMEARRWIDGRFADPEAPKKWLKERRPDIYDSLYPAKAEVSDRLKEAAKEAGPREHRQGHQAVIWKRIPT